MVICSTSSEIIVKTNDLINAAKPLDLKDKQNKTKYVVVSRGNENVLGLVVGNCTFKKVNDLNHKN